MRRRAAITRAVIPRLRNRAQWLLTGRTDEFASSEHRTPQLDLEEEGEDVNTDVEGDTPSLSLYIYIYMKAGLGFTKAE